MGVFGSAASPYLCGPEIDKLKPMHKPHLLPKRTPRLAPKATPANRQKALESTIKSFSAVDENGSVATDQETLV